MKNSIKELVRTFLICILLISIILIFISILNAFPSYQRFFKAILSVNAGIFTIYFLFKARLDQALTFIIICVLFNPLLNTELDIQVWRIIEFPILCLFIHRMYFLVFENELQQVEKDAAKIDQYFKELEHTISSLTYHQISLYIKRKYPDKCQITQENIIWTIPDLPDAEFEVQREFYSLGKNSKGGVNAKLINKYKNLEVHLNFNLTENVKFTIIEGKGKNKPNRLSRHLKTYLVTNYHYLDL